MTLVFFNDGFALPTGLAQDIAINMLASNCVLNIIKYVHISTMEKPIILQ